MIDYTTVIPTATEHAAESFPRESLGFVVLIKGRLIYVTATNKSLTSDTFISDPVEYAQISSIGKVVALVHSHPNSSSKPSILDQQAHAVSGLDWIILGLDGVTYLEGIKKPDLLGRKYVHGVTDCYAFVKDWYELNLKISLNDYPRDDHWWDNGQNLYLDNFEEAGFIEVDKPQDGYILLMQIGSSVPNHAAVFINGRIEHHLYGRLSCSDIYGQFYKDRTTHVLRYKND